MIFSVQVRCTATTKTQEIKQEMNAQSSYYSNNTNALLLSWLYSQYARALQPSVKAGVFSTLEVTLSQ